MAIMYEGKKIFPSAWEAGLREDEDQAQTATAAVGCCQKMESDMSNTASTMIHHDAVAYSYWKTFTLVLVALTLITLPIQLAGILSSSIQERLSELSYGLDVGFFIDLLINFRLTYVDPMTGMVKDDPRVVRNRYFFSYFWPDFLSIIPFEIFSGGGISMPAEIAELLGLLRFLRIRRLIELFKTLEKDENWSYTLVISFKFLFMLVILAHFAGCFMWWLSKLEPDPMDTWLSNTSDLIDSNDPFTKYIVGMYFAFTTITTVGYGDLLPVAPIERAFTQGFMLTNLALTAWIVGSVASLATKSDMTTATYRERLLELRRYNKRNNLDQIAPELLVDMRRCIELEHAQASAGNASGAFEASFPNFVTSRARNLRHRPMLERVELFNGGTAAASEFLTALTARAAEEVLMDGLRVFEANDVAQEAYILREGTANILIPDDTGCEQVVHTYGPGEVLGSESFFTGLSLPWSVRIVGFTRALKLTEADKRSLFAAFPEDGRAVARSLAVIVTDMRKSAALHLMWTTAEGGKLQAIRRWGKICESFMQGLAAQRAKEEQQIAETLCKLAANNLVAELQHLLQTEEVSKSTTDYEGRAAIHLAAAHGNNEVIEMLASESVSLDIIDKFGRSPLYEACINGHSSTVQLLKRLNAKLTLRDPGHELCRVVASGNKELLGLLLKAGADPAAEDYDQRTALHLAACEGDVMMTRLVMEYAECANPPATLRLLRATDRWGNTPIDEARNAGHAAITRLFAEHKLPSSGTTGQQAGRLGGRSRDSS